MASGTVNAPTRAVLQALLDYSPAGATGLDVALSAALPPGTVHPTLARLEGCRWIDSDWEDADPSDDRRPRRRRYRLNPAGLEQARQALREAERAQTIRPFGWRPAAGQA